MNFKELLVPLSLALLTTWALQYYFGARKPSSAQQPTNGSFIKAPTNDEIIVSKPLNLEVDFIDKAPTKKPITTTLETDQVRYLFSTNGASLESLEFKRKWGNNEGYLSTVFAPSATDREKRCFLVALNEKTPYYYELLNKTENNDVTNLMYTVDFEAGTLRKEYAIYKKLYRIDLTISLEPKKDYAGSLQARIFYPSPLIPQLGNDDWVKGIVADAHNTIQIQEKNEETLSGYWSKPTLFGTQDRYFINALIGDHNHFVQRGYFKIFDLENMYSILEGPSITTATSWKLSFYFGPKEDEALKHVDERLTQVLNYGWLAPISRPVSKILLDILNFLYEYFKNYGIAIIVLTCLMKLIMLPFTFGSERSMKKRVEFQKRLQHLQEKYKNDKEALAMARADLIRHHGMPGLGGCLPVLMQIPLFIALSWVLGNSIQLYMAPFLWIKDLSATDPYYILPILVGIAMLFHNPSQATGNNAQQKISVIAIAVIFAAFTANLSAGLVLYILTSTILGVVQSFFARKFAR